MTSQGTFEARQRTYVPLQGTLEARQETFVTLQGTAEARQGTFVTLQGTLETLWLETLTRCTPTAFGGSLGNKSSR